ncbi:ABC-three component system protein [uncultured Croceitalea sp.]|uniref:ABC-three component system protein n=1 Tax=uncultured Croceitalea sp. TaxID=1798908 RepID=UPI003306403B
MNKTFVKTDSATGSFAGYLYQFEQGLYSLLLLEESSSYLSIEDVDDIATHSKDGTVLITLQAKHSISRSGSTFSDNSNSLWRTIEIWLSKIEEGIFDQNTKFICATNKSIPEESLLYKISKNTLEDSIQLIKEHKKVILDKKKAKAEKGKDYTIAEKILPIINRVLKSEDSFKSIHSNLQIRDESELKEKIVNRLLLNSDSLSDLQRDNIYQALLGWLQEICLYKWRNGAKASVKKGELDQKYQSLINSPSIIKAIFRSKDDIDVGEDEINATKNELFVKQLEDISLNANAKRRLIKKAIEDYIRYEVEHTYIINEVGDFTKKDFDQFIGQCQEKWQETFDSFIVKELNEYSDEEMNSKAFEIYDFIMKKLEMNFQIDHSFNINNIYIKNGGFLKLSNIPEIGWHPNWEKLYKN